MALFVDKNGEGVVVDGELPQTARIAHRLRDLIMFVLKQNGMSLRFIGKVFNVSNVAVLNAIDGLPDDMKECHGGLRLEGLLSATRSKRVQP